MRFVDNNREAPSPMLVPDLVEDERELLYRRDDDLLAAFDEFPQVARMLRVTYRSAHLGELFDCRLNLLVEKPPIGDNNDRVKHVFFFLAQSDELMREPCDRVGFAAPCRMLNQITLTGTGLPDIG